MSLQRNLSSNLVTGPKFRRIVYLIIRLNLANAEVDGQIAKQERENEREGERERKTTTNSVPLKQSISLKQNCMLIFLIRSEVVLVAHILL